MPKKKEQIELRSFEVQEMMSHMPNWMIRWGISLIFGLILLLVFISWFVKYPDVIEGSVSISTKIPPIVLINKTAGEIQSIYFSDRKQVKKGDILATFGSGFSEEAKNHLIVVADNIRAGLKQKNMTVELVDDTLFLGIIYDSYIALKTSVLEYQQFLNNDPSAFEIATIREQIKNHTKLRSVGYEQLKTGKKQFANSEKKYEKDLKLFSQKIISEVQLFEEEGKLIQAENNVGNFKKTIVQSSITITDLKKQLNTLSISRKNKETKLVQSIEFGLLDIYNSINQWGKNFQIISPTAGELNYLKTLNTNEYVAANTPLFAVVPINQKFIGYIDVPMSGYGKVKQGQKVRVKIDKYPHQEFGQLEGRIQNIALLANEDSYRVDFELVNGMTSSYGANFVYTPDMTGQANIITEDISLLNRIFNKFRKVFDQ